MEDQTLRLAVHKALGYSTLPNHKWWGKDDNRHFQCENCKTTHSWREYRENGDKHPDGLCPGSDENYPEDLTLISDRLLNSISQDDYCLYERFLWAELDDWQPAIFARADQHCKAFLKFKEKYP
jgi:hypothetical protein